MERNHENERITHKKFRVSTVQRRKQFPSFRRPQEVGAFSQNAERLYVDDRSQLRFYCPPENTNECFFDLSEGCNSWKRKDELKAEYLDYLCRWIVNHGEVFGVSRESRPGEVGLPHGGLNTDFVCWRGLLTKLLCTPYEQREGWKIAVTLFNGTYYMCEFKTEEIIQQKLTETAYEKVLTYGGHKFEQYVTAEEQDGTPDTTLPVNNNEAFTSVVRTRLENHSLVFGAEIDCCTTETMRYIELKTSREIENAQQEQNFKKFKLIKWWAQSFLIGIDQIVCGFRDDNSIVHRLQTYPTLEIPEMCRDNNPDSWDEAVCFNFLDAFLQHIKDTVKVDDPRVAFLFEWNPKNLAITCVQHPRDSQFSFLQSWYYN